MEEKFEMDLALINKKGLVKKSPFYLTVIREVLFTVSVEQVPLTEYYVLIAADDYKDQLKIKVYRASDGRWYDKTFSEEAESNSPEFGIPAINQQLKAAIDSYESVHQMVK